MMQVNPMQLIQMMKQGQNPQQLILNILKQNSQNNPLFQNLYMLARQGKTQEIEKIARNIYREQGADFDKEFNAFKHQFGL
jgi:tryptophanase